MKNYTFEQLPAVVGRIEDQIDKILKILSNNDSHELKDDFLSIKEASQFLNLTVSTIYSKVNRCEIPVYKKGKRLYFSLLELQEWVKKGKKKTLEEVYEQSKVSGKSK